MSLNGKRDNFIKADLYSLEKISPLFNRRKINQLLDEICTAVSQWRQQAQQWQVPAALIKEVEKNLRLNW